MCVDEEHKNIKTSNNSAAQSTSFLPHMHAHKQVWSGAVCHNAETKIDEPTSYPIGTCRISLARDRRVNYSLQNGSRIRRMFTHSRVRDPVAGSRPSKTTTTFENEVLNKVKQYTQAHDPHCHRWSFSCLAKVVNHLHSPISTAVPQDLPLTPLQPTRTRNDSDSYP